MSYRSQSELSGKDPLNQAVILSEPPSLSSLNENSITFSQISQLSQHEHHFLQTPPEFRESEDYPFTRNFARRNREEAEIDETKSDPGQTIRMPTFKKIRKAGRRGPYLRPINPIDEEKEEQRQVIKSLTKEEFKTRETIQAE